jgi:hypothetical protein
MVLGDDDLNAHGSVVNDVPQQGWRYMQRALEALRPQVFRTRNDGSIAALGSSPSTATTNNAGAAIGVAAAAAGLTVTYYDGATAINNFFRDLGSGTINPAIIWIPGTFEGDFGGLVVLAKSTKIKDSVGNEAAVIIGSPATRASWATAQVRAGVEARRPVVI